MACNPEALKHVPLFALLDEDETAVLASQVELKNFAPRQRIYKMGDPGGQAYVMVSGTVRVTTIDQDHQEIVIDEPAHGEFFGFASMLEQTPHQTTAVALEETVHKFDIPKQPFDDLLKAFRQDQTITRYETFEDLLGYCRYSANPVGHLVLYLCGYRDPERQALSDSTCTALQLANFWQDVSDDYSKGRIYLPLEDLRRYRIPEEDISAARNTPPFREMMRFEVARARQWFQQGWTLVGRVDRELAVDIELFSRGGQEILKAIERQRYAVLGRRPAISKTRKLALVARAGLGKLLGKRV